MRSPPNEQMSGRKPDFIATHEEIIEFLSDLRRQKIRPHCGRRQERASDLSDQVSEHLFPSIVCLRRRLRLYATHGMFFPDVGLVVTDPDLRVVSFMLPASEGAKGECSDQRARVSHLGAFPELKPGDVLDEVSYGLNAFVLARRSGRVRAVAGAVHSCPQFKRMWTVAAPLGRAPLGYVGLLFAMHQDPYGYASWLVEVAEQIEWELRTEKEPSVLEEAALSEDEDSGEGNSQPLVRPSLAVRIPKSAVAKLSEREKEVLALLVTGASIGEIARKLHLSRSTVKTHLARIAEKWGIEPGVKSILMFIYQSK